MNDIISDNKDSITLFLLQELYQKERKKMKFKIKDEDLVNRDLEKVMRRIPLERRLKGVKPKELLERLTIEEILQGLQTEDLKKIKQKLDKLDLN